MNLALSMLNRPEINGLYHAFIKLQHTCTPWILQQISLYDFLFLNPTLDLFICTKDIIQPYFYEALQKYPKTKFIILEDIQLLPAANIINIPETSEKRNQILFLEIYEPQLYNNDELDYLQYLNNINYSFKIFSIQRLPFNTYLGVVDTIQGYQLLSNTDILISINNHLIYDAAYRKTFCLSNKPNNLFPYFSNITELKEQIEHYMSNEKHRKSIIKKAYKHIIDDHTYLNRAEQILEWSRINESTSVRKDFLESIK